MGAATMDPVRCDAAVRMLADLMGRLATAQTSGTYWEVTIAADGSGSLSSFDRRGYDPDPLVVVSFHPDGLSAVLEKLGIVSEDDGG